MTASRRHPATKHEGRFDEGTTILIVTHDNRILDVADRIVSMVDGKVVSNVDVATSMEICNFLRKCSVFEGTDPSVLAEVANQMTVESCRPSEIIIREGDPGTKFYLIHEGEVECFKGSAEDRQVLVRLGPGDFFGELALLKDSPRAASVQALDEVQLFVLEREGFLAAVQSSPGLEEQLRNVWFSK